MDSRRWANYQDMGWSLDPWRHPPSRIEGPLMLHDENSHVSSSRTNHTWTFDSLHVPLPPQLEKLIKGIPVAYIARLSNTFIWPHNNGTCSVSLASKFLYHQQQVPTNKQFWNWIWKLQCPKKIQIFLWKAMRNRLPTRQYLTFSRQHLNDHCPICNTQETTIHILHGCLWAKEVWGQPSRLLPLSFFHMTLQAWLQSNATAVGAIMHQQLPWNIYFHFLCWNLWLARNERIFKNQSRS